MKSTNIIVGIDNGKQGGLVALDGNTNDIIEKVVMPTLGGTGKSNAYNLGPIRDFLKKHEPTLVVLEKTLILGPRTSKVGAMSSGYCLGMLEGICTALELRYVVVSPKLWQKKVFAGMVKMKDTKKTALIFANRMYPKEDWTKSERATKPHDGMIDALCLAIYGKQVYC